MDEHRVPMLGGAWRRHSDPMRSPDPRVRELVGALAGLEVAPAPRAEFRAELRAQLVAVTPRLVAEGEPPTPVANQTRVAAAEKAAKAEADAAARTTRRRLHFAKPLIAAACVLTAFVLLLGGAVLISRNALPGDALYGIKRASEDTEYSLAGSAVDKGKLKLEFAGRRIGEVAALLPRASSMAAGSGAMADGGGLNPATTNLVGDTLGSADGDVQTAAQLLGGDSVRTGDPAPLEAITAWTPGQIVAMHKIVMRIPAGGLHRRALATLTLLRQAQQRATTLRSQLGCNCLDPGNADQLGPRPCATSCSAPVTTKPHPKPGRGTNAPAKRHGQSSSAHPGPAVSVPAVSTPPAAQKTSSGPPPSSSTSQPPVRRTTPGRSPSPAPTGGVTSPSVPLPTIPGLGGSSGSGHSGGGTHLPISVDSCGVSVSAGPVQIGVGGC